MTHSETDDIGDVARCAALCGLEGVDNMNLLAGGDVLVDAAAVAGLGLWAWDGGAHLWMPGGVGEGGPVGGRGRARRGGDERGRLAGDRGREGRARGGAGGGGGGKGVGGGVRIHVGDRGGWAVRVPRSISAATPPLLSGPLT